MQDITAHLTINEWDTDGEKVKLPKKVKVTLTVDGEVCFDTILYCALDAASDKYGWCITSGTLTRIDLN